MTKRYLMMSVLTSQTLEFDDKIIKKGNNKTCHVRKLTNRKLFGYCAAHNDFVIFIINLDILVKQLIKSDSCF